MTRLILLDRDGVINVNVADYVRAAEQWIPIPGVPRAIARLQSAGFLIGVCTNQAGIGRGLFDESALARIHRKMARELAGVGAHLDALRWCPHVPEDACGCRKPRPGMLLDIMGELHVSATETIFVGDAIRDVEAAHAAGCRAALVRTGHGARVEPIARGMGVDWVGDDLAAFADWALTTATW
ncbi:MAG: D-glycero-beta-D-manno-heptose 1,7-bisphosphate 7-phosphatase [Pseudomonadales bacterium]